MIGSMNIFTCTFFIGCVGNGVERGMSWYNLADENPKV